MKNEKMVRNIPYVRENLYFSDVRAMARFVNLYKHLFVGTVSGAEPGWFCCKPVRTNKKDINYYLICFMNREDIKRIRRDLKIRRRKYKDDYGYERTISFVC